MVPATTPILQLSASVVEKIAAGEVVERPASVLKELIENAIDAGATVIDAQIENAGFSRIKVSDNGGGMSQENLGKCLLPHATSKIRNAEDLFAVTTMGFRGEALASIAAVSRLTVSSADGEAGLGHEISVGEERSRPVAHARGTSVEVCDLFYNVPARKKFMKSLRSEQMAIVRTVEQLAIPFPLIHFILKVDGRKLLDLPSATTPLDRIGAVAGPAFARGLIACEASREGLEVVAYVSSPEQPQTRPRFQSLYVNLRRVDNDGVLYAIREAHSRFISSQFRPSFFFFIDVDPARIDVNVHPTKQQVKFDDERALSGFVYSAVKQGIGMRLESPPLPDGSSEHPGHSPSTDEAHQEAMRFPPRERVADRFQPAAGEQSHVPEADARTIPFPAEDGDVAGSDIGAAAEVGETSWDLISCYQIHESYILAPIKNGILLIDQHAAHERILFEQAMEDIGRGRAASQQLLFPVTVELTAVERTVVLSGREYFAAFGFETGEFGGETLLVSAIPFFIKTFEVEEIIRSMVRYLLDERERESVRDPRTRFAAAFACGAAIKAGQKLNQEEMNSLVNTLFAAKNPYICPHGRPTLVRISLDELSRRFLR